MCETFVLVFTEVPGLIEVIIREDVTKNRASMTAKGTMNVYQGLPFYITITSFGKADVYHPNH